MLGSIGAGERHVQLVMLTNGLVVGAVAAAVGAVLGLAIWFGFTPRLETLTGRLEEARQRVAVARGYSADLRLTLGRIAAAQVESLIESSNGEHRRAYELLAACARDLAAAGQRAMAAMFQVRAAWELVRAGDAPAASTLASAVEPAGLGTEERIVHLLIGAHVKAAASAVPGALVAVAICARLAI